MRAPRRLGRPARRQQLRLVLDRARPGDQREAVAADRYPADVDHRVVRVELAPDQLVGREDRLDRLDIGMMLEAEFGQHPLVAEGAEHDPLAARHVKRFQPLRLDPGEQFVDDLGRRVGLHHDDH